MLYICSKLGLCWTPVKFLVSALSVYHLFWSEGQNHRVILQHFPSSRLALYVFPSFSSCSVSFFCFQTLFAQYLGPFFSHIPLCVCVYVQHGHSFTCMIESCSSRFYVQKLCFLLSPFIFNGLHSCSLNFIQTHLILFRLVVGFIHFTVSLKLIHFIGVHWCLIHVGGTAG